MSDLVLHVKRKWFDQIKAGTKKEEFRRVSEYWIKRLVGKDYDRVCIAMGYPRKDDPENWLYFHWNGYAPRRIRHEEWGNKPVAVLAISLHKPIN